MSSVSFETGPAFRELNEMEMYVLKCTLTEMEATIERNTSQNTNSLISSGYFIENYSEDDSDKENNSTNNIDAMLESSEDDLKTLAQRTSGLTLVPFLPPTISLLFSVPLTTKIRFSSIAFFCFLLLNSLFLFNGLAHILCSTSHVI